MPVFKEGRDEVLSRVLLHVVEPPPPVQRHPNRLPRRQWGRITIRSRGAADEVDGSQTIGLGVGWTVNFDETVFGML